MLWKRQRSRSTGLGAAGGRDASRTKADGNLGAGQRPWGTRIPAELQDRQRPVGLEQRELSTTEVEAVPEPRRAAVQAAPGREERLGRLTALDSHLRCLTAPGAPAELSVEAQTVQGVRSECFRGPRPLRQHRFWQMSPKPRPSDPLPWNILYQASQGPWVPGQTRCRPGTVLPGPQDATHTWAKGSPGRREPGVLRMEAWEPAASRIGCGLMSTGFLRKAAQGVWPERKTSRRDCWGHRLAGRAGGPFPARSRCSHTGTRAHAPAVSHMHLCTHSHTCTFPLNGAWRQDADITLLTVRCRPHVKKCHQHRPER